MYRLLSVLLLLTSCGPPPAGRGVLPYRFRQSLLSDDSRERVTARRSTKKIEQKQAKREGLRGQTARCRALVGRPYSGPRERALARLLTDCLGAPLPTGAVRAQGLALRDDLPLPLDLVFFRGTQDAPGRAITDAGVVLVQQHGRVEFLHLRLGHAALGVMNLRHPHRRRSGQRVENSYLRVIRPDDPPRTPYLAAQLLAGFASLD